MSDITAAELAKWKSQIHANCTSCVIIGRLIAALEAAQAELSSIEAALNGQPTMQGASVLTTMVENLKSEARAENDALRQQLAEARARIVLSYVSFLGEFCDELERGTCMLGDFDPSLIQRLKKALEGEAR